MPFCRLLINITVCIHSIQAPVYKAKSNFSKLWVIFVKSQYLMISHCQLITRPSSAEIFISTSLDLAMTDGLWRVENSYIHLEPGNRFIYLLIYHQSNFGSARWYVWNIFSNLTFFKIFSNTQKFWNCKNWETCKSLLNQTSI